MLDAKIILVLHFHWVFWEVLSMNLEPCRTFKAKIIKFMLLNIIH